MTGTETRGTIASMTGFARVEGAISDRLRVGIVARSVNHRFLDVMVRHGLKEELPELEALVRETVAARVRRGRVTVQLRFAAVGSAGGRAAVDTGILAGIAEAVTELELPGIERSVRLGELLAVPSVVRIEEGGIGLTEAELGGLRTLLEEAVGAFDAMRRREAETLRRQLLDELDAVERFTAWLGERVEGIQERLVEALRERVLRLLGPDVEPDPARLLQEAALAADRADVREELVRLESHVAEFRRRLDEGGAVGKVLDFLCQEFNRELNTIGSKARDAGVAARLVDAKAAVERLREQVQNIE